MNHPSVDLCSATVYSIYFVLLCSGWLPSKHQHDFDIFCEYLSLIYGTLAKSITYISFPTNITEHFLIFISQPQELLLALNLIIPLDKPAATWVPCNKSHHRLRNVISTCLSLILHHISPSSSPLLSMPTKLLGQRKYRPYTAGIFC